MNSYVPLREACATLGLKPATLRAWAQSGKIKTIKTPHGQFLYNRQALSDLTNTSPPAAQKKKIIYARVSSPKQKDDLERQVSYLQSRYPDYDLIKDCGSGINWKRKGLQTILEYALSGNLEEVVVAHRDRMSRLGFELIEWIITKSGGKVRVLDSDEHKSPEQDLSDDLLSIVQIYSCKQMGRRRYSKDSKNQVESIPSTKKDIEELVRDQ